MAGAWTTATQSRPKYDSESEMHEWCRLRVLQPADCYRGEHAVGTRHRPPGDRCEKRRQFWRQFGSCSDRRCWEWNRGGWLSRGPFQQRARPQRCSGPAVFWRAARNISGAFTVASVLLWITELAWITYSRASSSVCGATRTRRLRALTTSWPPVTPAL
jgi:hypothetical protein